MICSAPRTMEKIAAWAIQAGRSYWKEDMGRLMCKTVWSQGDSDMHTKISLVCTHVSRLFMVGSDKRFVREVRILQLNLNVMKSTLLDVNPMVIHHTTNFYFSHDATILY
mmetsp:Transcript_14300/g.25128  ORF Transcript_14300/g.25128 Transcript_14300/m.25128 type:complete len:110 (+) Transcript_14300:367-696(+)